MFKIDKIGFGIVGGFMLALMIGVGSAMAGSDQPAPSGDTSAADANEQQQTNDPLEPLNRVTSGFNRVFRKVIADPLISGYQAITPDPVQRAISNFGSNLTEPVTALSSFLQGDSENANNAMSRFFVNTTVGMAGISDQATAMGIMQRREDLGQAAGAAGAGGGAHIVLPFFGPSNMRDITGDILTSLADPLYTATSAINAGTSYAENRDQINAITDTAIDPYVVERDAYEQNRKYRINNGDSSTMSDIPDYEKQAAPDQAKAAN